MSRRNVIRRLVNFAVELGPPITPVTVLSSASGTKALPTASPPSGWRTVGFDDSGWEVPTEIGA